MRKITAFCGQCQCGCPELLIDPDAPDEQRIVITDDFGQRIQMSLAQLTDLVDQAKTGMLDNLVAGGS